MTFSKTIRQCLLAALPTFAAAALVAPVNATAVSPTPQYQHVLLISVDGMHAVDLANYVAHHPGSTLAALSGHGVTYPHAYCPRPSDSFPGLTALVTGGLPKSAGVYYDDSYNRALLPPISAGGGNTPGTEVNYSEALDYSLDSLDGGASMHGGVTINPDNLPRDPSDGHPVYPHEYLRVNTIFEVAHANGLYTAWSDKHAAYELVRGNSNTGAEDLYTPEINSVDPATETTPGDPSTGKDYTKAESSVTKYDTYKVNAIINEIDGMDHTGTSAKPVPAIFGMNFQAVSVGQKLKTGGYDFTQPFGTPKGDLVTGLNFVDAQLGRIVNELSTKGLSSSTLVIITAKHGQSPIDRSKLRKIDDGATFGAQLGTKAAFYIADDATLIWLTSPSFIPSALNILNANRAADGIGALLSGSALKRIYGVDSTTDARVPDIINVADYGVVYTTGSKIAEHGGFSQDDTNVLLLVANPAITGTTVNSIVETKQVAPTILQGLGISPQTLKAVQLENTPILPGLGL